MRIMVIESFNGSPDHVSTVSYNAGEVYDLFGDLAKYAVRNGVGVPEDEYFDGLEPDSPALIETTMEPVEETRAFCGRVFTSGKRAGQVCNEAKPCRYHDR